MGAANHGANGAIQLGFATNGSTSSWNDPDFVIRGHKVNSAFDELFRIESATGNVGIGTDSPSSSLHIIGPTSGSTKGLIVNNGASTGNIFEAQDNGTAVFTVADGGNVSLTNYIGIAGATPGASIGGQTAALNVTGYSGLGGLRVNGADTGNTIYSTSAIGITGSALTLTGSIGGTGLTSVTLAGGTISQTSSQPVYIGKITGTFTPASGTSTSTGLAIQPVINWGGTPGAGSYEALRIAVTETSLPTGTKYLIRASAGAAGTTDMFTVENTGLTTITNSSASAKSLVVNNSTSTGNIAEFQDNGSARVVIEDGGAIKVYSSGSGNPTVFAIPAGSGTGVGNITIGEGAGDSMVGDAQNVLIGTNAGTALVGGSVGNTAIGFNAMDAASGAGVDNNVAVGANALGGSLTAGSNVAIGHSAGIAVTSGSSNVFLGRSAGSTNTTGSSNILIGDSAVASAAGASNELVIGSTSSFISNAYFNGVTSATPVSVVLNAAGGSGTDIAGASLTFAGGKGTGAGDGGSILFQTAPSGSTGTTLGTLATRMTIDSDGLVGIGTTPSYALDVLASGTGVIARFNSTNATGCTLADGGTITCTSDERMKKNIEDITYGLETLKELRPVLFNWNYEDDEMSKNLGFIAQDVEALMPKLVATDENGMKALNTTGMIPVIVKSVQEVNLNVEGLVIKVAEHESRISALEAKVAELQALLGVFAPEPEPTPEVTPEPTPEITPEVIPEPEPEIVPEPEPEVAPESEVVEEVAPEPTPEPAETPAI